MYSVPEDLRLSKNFTLSEFACNDGSKEITVNYELIELLQQLRDTLGKPIKVTSGYRTVTYNKKCGGIATSHHLTGKAAGFESIRRDPHLKWRKQLIRWDLWE